MWTLLKNINLTNWIMKKSFYLFLLSLMPVLASAAQYYVAGDGRANNPWCDGLNWKVNGSAMSMDSAGRVGTITFVNVPVGAYQFKVTNGTSSWYGINKMNKSCSNLYYNGSDNICFSLQQQQDITITYDGTKICLSGSVGNASPDPSQFGKYGVPSEYEGVMLQGFYWNSYNGTKYGRTKYIDWLNNGWASEVGRTFDLVWLPPSGMGGGTGYYTKTYSNLDSDWGSRAKLKELIDTLHANGCKVLADVVVNHRASSSGWARSFTSENFGSYGTFQITSEHICSGDEAFTSSQSDSKTLPHGAADTGDNDAGCRDLDHTNPYVQDYVKAYVQWLIHTVGFDGFRYDMVKGYSGMYLSMYNQASDPFFSVAEYWDDLAPIKSYLESASYNTTAFDFPLKYKFNAWKGGSAYSNLKNTGMRGQSLSKYAVTFIDNHDTFERSDNPSGEFLGYNVVLTDYRKPILQANAYLLMMPGTPCVSWPHWYTFKSDISQLIALRHLVGIHSESKVSAEATATNAYTATIAGHRGSAILRMGSARDMTMPEGYTLSYQGPEMEIYTMLSETAVETQESVEAAIKVFENGQLYILSGGHKFTTTGVLVY